MTKQDILGLTLAYLGCLFGTLYLSHIIYTGRVIG